jgi:hypothetical protein
MCNPASFVVTKDRVFWSKHTNSHSRIIEEFGLHADGVGGPNTVSVEIKPPDGDYGADPATWRFNTDQDVLPEWYDAGQAEAACRLELTEWAKWHCCNQGSGATGEQVAGGDMVSQRSGNESTQKAGYESTQKAGSASTQTAGDRSTQTAGYESTQTAGDRSTQTAGYESTQKAGYESTQTAGYESTQTAGDRSTQTAGYESTQKAGSASTQTAGDRSTQKAGSASTQTAGDRSTQKAGLLTVQITRWYDNGWHVAMRTIGPAEADKWYRVEKGVWRECTAEESAEAEAKIKSE